MTDVIQMSDLYTDKEMADMGRYRSSFSFLIENLRRKVPIAKRFPLSFTINGIEYNFPNELPLLRSIKALEAEFERLVSA